MPQKNSPGFAPVIILTLGFLLGSLITITAVTDNPVKNQVMRALAVSIPNRFEQRDAGLTQYNGAHDYSATEIAAGEKKIAAQEAKRKLSDAKSNGDARTAGGAADAGTAGNTAGTKNTTPLTGGVDGRGTPPGGYTSIQQIVKSGAAVGTVGYDCGGLGKCGYDPTLEVSGFYNAGTPENPHYYPVGHDAGGPSGADLAYVADNLAKKTGANGAASQNPAASTIKPPQATTNGQCGIGMTAEGEVCRNTKTGAIVPYANIVLYNVAIGNAASSLTTTGTNNELDYVKSLCKSAKGSDCGDAALKQFGLDTLNVSDKTLHDQAKAVNDTKQAILDKQKADDAAARLAATQPGASGVVNLEKQKINSAATADYKAVAIGTATKDQIIKLTAQCGATCTDTEGLQRFALQQLQAIDTSVDKSVYTDAQKIFDQQEAARKAAPLPAQQTHPSPASLFDSKTTSAGLLSFSYGGIQYDQVRTNTYITYDANGKAIGTKISRYFVSSDGQKVIEDSFGEFLNNNIFRPVTTFVTGLFTPKTTAPAPAAQAPSSGFKPLIAPKPVPSAAPAPKAVVSVAPAPQTTTSRKPTDLTASGTEMYNLYEWYKNTPGWWNKNVKGNFTAGQFLGLMLQAESKGSTADLLAAITEATTNEIWAKNNPYAVSTGGQYCKSSDCAGGIMNFLSVYADSAKKRYSQPTDNAQKRQLILDEDQSWNEKFSKYGLSIDQLADILVTNHDPSAEVWSNDKPSHWGCYTCGAQDQDILLGKVVNSPSGTTDVNGVYFKDSTDVVYTSDQATRIIKPPPKKP